jgi:hypothetical protein
MLSLFASHLLACAVLFIFFFAMRARATQKGSLEEKRRREAAQKEEAAKAEALEAAKAERVAAERVAAARKEEAAREAEEAARAAARAAAMSNEWSCAACTAINPNKQLLCSTCSEPAPLQKRELDQERLRSLCDAVRGTSWRATRGGAADTGHFRGFENMGNTCWMNSALQALASAPSFARTFNVNSGALPLVYLKPDDAPTPRYAGALQAPITAALTALYTACADAEQGAVLQPAAFKAALDAHPVLRCAPPLSPPANSISAPFVNRRPPPSHFVVTRCTSSIYRGTSQHDSATFVCRLLDTLVDETAHPASVAADDWSNVNFASPDGKAPPSVVRDIFGIKSVPTSTYAPCGHELKRVAEYDSTMKLPLPKGRATLTLQDCFNAYANCDALNPFQCGTCKTPSKSEKTSRRLVRAPEALLLYLQRFVRSEVRQDEVRKDNTPVAIPLELDTLFPLVDAGSPFDAAYELAGVVQHSGSMHAGEQRAAAPPHPPLPPCHPLPCTPKHTHTARATKQATTLPL